jgi:hypothetical protein
MSRAEAYAWSVTRPGDWVGLLRAIQDYLAGAAGNTGVDGNGA